MRGTINIPAPIKDTLKQLHLDHRYRATIVPDNPVFRGMLSKVKDRAAWYTVDDSTVEMLMEKRGRREGWKPLEKGDLGKIGFKSFKTLAKAVGSGKTVLPSIKGVKPFFALAPPRGGFKRSTRRMYRQGGILGENPELLKLVESMV